MVRSILLRGFDRDMAEFVGEDLENRGIRILYQTLPKLYFYIFNNRITKNNKTNKIIVEYDKESEEFDTVLFAIGRKPMINDLGLENCGVEINKNNGKIIAPNDKTTSEDIYAIGDIVSDRPELTPV